MPSWVCPFLPAGEVGEEAVLPHQAAHHDSVDGKFFGKHDLIIRFLRSARRLNPPRSRLIPSWDLSVVWAYRVLLLSPWSQLSWLSYFWRQPSWLCLLPSSISTFSLVGVPAYSHVILRPWPGYLGIKWWTSKHCLGTSSNLVISVFPIDS